MHQPVRKFAVVRQQQGSGGIPVEPSDGKHPVFCPYKIQNGCPPLLIACCGDAILRLVEKDIDPRILEDDDLFFVVENLVPGRIDPDTEVTDDLAVDADPSFLDQFVRLPAGDDPCL
jgi:hypothetical protein